MSSYTLEVLITVGVWVEVVIGALTLFVAVAHFNISFSRKQPKYDICGECGFNIKQGGRCIVCSGFGS